MGKVILYAATSLDGYIADKDGGVNWLEAFNEEGLDYGYGAFYASLETLIMGGKTYRQIIGFGAWPYPGVRTYVVTSQEVHPAEGEDVRAYQDDLTELVAKLKESSPKDIWLVGGGELNATFFEKDLIDLYMISVMPVMLGDGIPLVKGVDKLTALELIDSEVYPNGVVQLGYKKNN